MKEKIFILILLLTGSCLFGQISYENGYTIDFNGKRQECLIKNMDWKNNPGEFQYKINAGDESLKASPETVKEFAVYGNSKYVSYEVKIDTTVADLNNLTYVKNPVLSEERLFLKVLIEGAATLYSYNNGNLLRFFYSTSDTIPQQLVYREYLKEDGTYGVNNRFRQQLWADLKCAFLKTSDVEKLSYYSNPLIKYFSRYNDCMGLESTDYKNKVKKDIVDLSVIAGVNLVKPIRALNGETDYMEADFDSQISYSLGMRTELILPFNKGKWRVLFEPVYQHYSSETESNYTYQRFCKTSLKFDMFDLAIGLRYCFYLDDHTSFSIDGLYNYGFVSKSSKLVYEAVGKYNLGSMPCFVYGGGINYKRVSLQMRYFLNRDLLNNYVSWYAGFQKVSISLGVKMF